MNNGRPTCGLENKLPTHMIVEEGEQRCYDSRPCHYKVILEHDELYKKDVCSYECQLKVKDLGRGLK